MKRRDTLTLLSLGAATWLTACGGGSGSSTSTDSTGTDSTSTNNTSTGAGGGVTGSGTTDTTQVNGSTNLVALAQSDPNLSFLVEAVMAANLQDALSAPGPLTLFAPTNDAFTQLLSQLNISKTALLASGALLADILRYHVVAGRVLKANIPIDSPITTLEGSTFTVSSRLVITDQLLGSSRITATDVLASNGAVHVIDRVLLHRLVRV